MACSPGAQLLQQPVGGHITRRSGHHSLFDHVAELLCSLKHQQWMPLGRIPTHGVHFSGRSRLLAESRDPCARDAALRAPLLGTGRGATLGRLWLGRSLWTRLSPPIFSLLPSPAAGGRERQRREREREYCLRPATVRGGGGRDGDDTMWGDRRWREAGRTATAQRAAATTDPCIAHRSPLDDATATNKSADKAPAVAVALLIVFTATANGREGGRESEARGGDGRERERESGERREWRTATAPR